MSQFRLIIDDTLTFVVNVHEQDKGAVEKLMALGGIMAHHPGGATVNLKVFPEPSLPSDIRQLNC